jgi:hypothetical protein
MKAFYKIGLIGIFLCIAGNAFATFYYTIRVKSWDFAPAYDYQTAIYTYHLDNKDSGVVSISKGTYSVSFTTESRIVSLDRDISYYSYGVVVHDRYSGMSWSSSEMHFYPGSGPIAPVMYYTTYPTIKAFDGSTEIAPGSMIDFGKKITIQITRNGYPGPLPIYFGSSSALSNNVLFTIPSNVTSDTVVLSDYWSKLSSYFGGDYNVVNKDFYLGFRYIISGEGSEYGVIAKTNVLGRFGLSGNLVTNPENTQRLCANQSVICSIQYINTPYVVHIKQGTVTEKTLIFYSSPITLDYNTIRTVSEPSNNFEIEAYHIGYPLERTKRITVNYLKIPPNITGATISTGKLSCEGKGDGKINISLPNESLDSVFRYTYTKLTTINVEDDRNVTFLVDSGNYHVLVDRKYENPADYGCYSDLGSVMVGIYDKLTINSIIESKTQSCSNKNDAELTVITSGGVPGDIDYFVGGTRYDNNIIGGLAGGTPYIFKAIDTKNCESDTKSDTTSITAPLIINVTGRAEIKCFGDKGSFTLSGSGGHNAYQYSLNGGAYTSSTFFGNIPGLIPQSIKMRDSTLIAEACTTSTQVTFDEPPQLTFTDPAFTLSNYNGYHVKCNGEYSGVITLHHTGGTDPVQCALIGIDDYGPQDNAFFPGLQAGSYQASLTDSNGCKTDLATPIVLTQPEGVTLTDSVISLESCPDTEDASIVATLSANVTSFQWYNGEISLENQTSSTLSGIGAGLYSLEAYYHAGACSTKFNPIPIAAKAPVDFSHTTYESCADGIGGGSIMVSNVIHGNNPYTYSFNNGPGTDFNGDKIVFDHLDAGQYAIEVRDSNYIRGGKYAEKCYSTKVIDIIAKGVAGINVDITPPLCHGESDGMLTAIVSGSDQPYIHAWFDAENDSVGTGNLLINLHADTFYAIIKDTLNCSVVKSGFTVNEPSKLLINNVIQEDAACNEIHDGIITLTASGGIAPYQYSSNGGSTWQSYPVFNGLASDSYNLQIRDAHACITDSSAILDAFNPRLTETAFDSVTCFGANDGMMTVKANGSKTGIYTYYLQSGMINTSNATGIFNNLASHDYASFARDSKGCFTDTLNREIREPEDLTVQLTLLDSASCSQHNGKISYSIGGGNGGNQLLWYNSSIGETSVLNINSLQTGSYTLTVRDRKSCSTLAMILVPDRPAPVITGIDILTQSWCGLPLGSARVNVTGGSPGYTYLWNNDDQDLTAVADELTMGTYMVTVTDRYNCMDQEVITLQDGPPISLTTSIEDPHCGQNDGIATLTVSGGVGPFSFKWPNAVAIEPVISNRMDSLYSGTYPVSVTDDVGCSKEFQISLSDLNGPGITSVRSTKSWCRLPQGTAEVIASGGALPYTYAWSPSGLTSVIGTNAYIDRLKSGIYTLTITDDENCKVLSDVEILDSLELQPVLSLSFDSSACNKPLGSISASMSKGLAPYTYSWNNGASTAIITNLVQGTYRVEAMDQRGCRDSSEIQLPDRKLPSISLLSKENSYCGWPTGSASISGALGRAPYQAYLVQEPEKKATLILDIETNRHIGEIDSLLPLPDQYNIRLSDADGCESPVIGVLINDDNPMSVQLLDIMPVSCYGLSDGQAEITAGNGFEPYTYLWNVNSINSAINSTLPAGPFTVSVTDARNCTKTLYVTETPITQPAPVMLSSIHITQPSCNGVCDGTISPIATGGNGGYIYLWNQADTANTGTGLCPGENRLEIIDIKGCLFEDIITILNPAPLTGTDLVASTTLCSGQHFLADPGSEWNNVSWTSNNGFASSEHIADIVANGVYYMRGFSDNGCLVQDTIHIMFTDDLLDAQFLMMSEAYAGDTVIIIEVSWPVAESYDWELPESASILNDNGYYKELVFDESGTFYVQLTATLAGCTSIKGKYIDILDITEKPEEEEIAENPALIKSFDVYPNPAVLDFNADIQLSEQKDIRVEIISISGGNLHKVIMDYGLNNYTVNVNVEELPRGTYIIRLIAGSEAKTKILIVR